MRALRVVFRAFLTLGVIGWLYILLWGFLHLNATDTPNWVFRMMWACTFMVTTGCVFTIADNESEDLREDLKGWIMTVISWFRGDAP